MVRGFVEMDVRLLWDYSGVYVGWVCLFWSALKDEIFGGFLVF